MARYDLELVRTAASGRWVEILSSLGGVSADILDGRAHPCPKHCLYGNKSGETPGGNDRFRAIEIDKGALLCNCCFREKNGDGFAALQWLTGKGFGEVLESVAKHCGVKAEKKKKTNPAEYLEFLHWNDTTIGLWCEKKLPITPDAVKQVGGRIARYRGEFTVIAIPVWGPSFDNEDPVGWALYRADGGMLPYYGKKGDAPEWKKILLSPGSQQGMIGDPRQLSALVARQANSETTDHSAQASDAIAADIWSKLEGPSDLLTALSQPFPSGYKFWTTANGSMEIPLDWIIALFKGIDCYVCHDCDVPGQQGATWVDQRDGRRPGWAPRLATVAKSVKNLVLPFPIEPSHGPDVRDFFNGGGTVQGYLELAEDSKPIESRELTVKETAQRSEDDPGRLAEVNLKRYRETGRDLRYWNDEWYQYKGTHYTRLGIKKLHPRVWEAVQKEFLQCWHEKKDRQSKPVTKVSNQLVSNVISAMCSECYTRSDQKINSWIDNDGPDECVALKNGILNLSELFKTADQPNETRILLPHTSNFFTTVCLPYEFDPAAKCPTWLKFLDTSFNGDGDQIDTLQKWFGLQLTPITRFQKMLFVIGPPRSGKGTIQRTLMAMLGRETVATPSINDLAGQWALHSLMDKTVAIISDARLSNKADSIAITEKLLSIIGEDPQDIQRKYMDTLPGVKMQVRFTLFSNMLPNLKDQSSAFLTRTIFLSMPNSYVGKEDVYLGDKIMQELPGILNWAIAGRFRLLEANKFTQPVAGRKHVNQLRMAMSPVAAFVDDLCDPDGEVEVRELYQAYCTWCSDNDQSHKQDITAFGKSLHAVLSTVERVRSTKGSRPYVYRGISLKSAAATGF